MIKTKTENNNLSKKAYQYIKSLIISGKLTSSNVISEESLARAMGISRTPIREAVRRLSIEGVLEQIPRYGTVVRELSLTDIVEINELREALEPYAVVKSIDNLTDADINLLKELCEEVKEFIDKLKKNNNDFLDEQDTRRFLAIDLGFHMIIIRSANNKRILDVLVNARTLTRLFGSMNEIGLSKLENTYERHMQIYHAIKNKDADSAEKAMKEHLALSMQPAMKQYADFLKAHQGDKVVQKGNSTVSLTSIIKECGMAELIA